MLSLILRHLKNESILRPEVVIEYAINDSGAFNNIRGIVTQYFKEHPDAIKPEVIIEVKQDVWDIIKKERNIPDKAGAIGCEGVRIKNVDYKPEIKEFPFKDKKFSPPPYMPKMRGLGDLVERAARPIAKVLDRTVGTHLEGCDGCRKRKEKLNQLVPFGQP